MKAEKRNRQWFHPECSSGKRAYVSRRAAKHAARQVANLGHPGCRPYVCPTCGYWHIGHKPQAAMTGDLSADQVYRAASGE